MGLTARPVASNHRHTGWLVGLAVVALLASAAWLRWLYANNVGVHIDEFTTLWAARRILEAGIPVMPSGLLYARGLIPTYVIAAVGAVGDLTYLTGRLPSVAFGVATVAAVFLAGRREWNARVGWLAALGLALLPEAIDASRARFYAALLCFSLLTVWAFFAAVRHPVPEDAASPPSNTSSRNRNQASWGIWLLCAGLFAVTLFSQEQAVLLVPSLALGVLLWRGWRYLLQPPVLVAAVVCGGATAVRFLLERRGTPDGADIVQGNKAFIELFADVDGAWRVFSPLYVDPEHIAWTLFAVVGLAAALGALWHVRGRIRRLPLFHQATLFFALQWLAVLTIIFTLTGPSWRDGRYVLMLQPFWLLVGAAGAVWLIDRLVRGTAWRWLLTGALSVALIWLVLPSTQRVVAHESESYQQALEYVAAHRQPGDVVMSPQPAACAFVMDASCDYYARELDLGTYVVERDGVMVDRWTGAPLVASAAKLEEVVRQPGRAWLVLDGDRLGRRYGDDYVRTIVQQFDSEFDSHDVRALLATDWQEPPPYTVTKTPRQPVVVGPLTLIGWQRTAPEAGDFLFALLSWRQTEPVEYQINTSLQLVAPDGTRLSQDDGPPARGFLSTVDRAEATIPDPMVLQVPADLPPGRYRLEVVAYNVETQDPLGLPVPIDWFRLGPEPAAPAQETDVAWEHGMRLAGHAPLPETLAPGAPLTLRLLWETSATLPADYTAFVHLVGPDGNLVAQSDRAPEGGFYPTSAWEVGERVADTYTLEVPETLAPGEYRLQVGWYEPGTGARLATQDGQDSWLLARWRHE